MAAERESGAAAPFSVLAAARERPEGVALLEDARATTWGELGGEVAALLRRWETEEWSLPPAPDRSPEPAAGPPEVALVGAGDPDTVTVVLALIEAGIPFLLLHPRSTPAEHEGLLEDSGARRFLAPEEVEAQVEQAGRQALESGDWPRPRRPPSGATLALLHTSGTSGRPKGAVLTRGALLAAVRASEANLGWQPQDRWLLSLPLAHVGGLSIVLRCLAARRTIVLPPPGPFRAEELRERVERLGVTLLSLVPTMLDRCLALEPPWTAPAPLRAVLVGGAATPASLFARAVQADWPVLTTYGMTEACSQIATQRLDAAPAGIREGGVDVGPPVEGIELRVVSADRDGVGPIEIRGPGLFRGYWSEGRLERPFDPRGWFSTGDYGRLDEDGTLHVVARRRDLVVSGGENVYPAEVERVLESHPGIARAAVVGIPDEEWGERVAAALVPTAEPLPEATLAAFLATRLAPFKRPRRFLWLDRLPLTAGEKLDRDAVRARLAIVGSGRGRDDDG